MYMAAFGSVAAPTGLKLLHQLRAAGVPADIDYRAGTLKAHLRQADRMGCALTLILGDDEAAKGIAIVRNMQTKQQEEVALSEAVSTLAARLSSCTSALVSSATNSPIVSS